MKFALLIAICLLPLSKLYTKEKFPPPWVEVNKTIPELTKTYKGKRVLVLFAADWCLVSSMVKLELASEKLRDRLEETDSVLAIIDCTNADSVGIKELKRMDIERVLPVLAVIDKEGKITHPPVELSDDEPLEESIRSFVKELID